MHFQRGGETCAESCPERREQTGRRAGGHRVTYPRPGVHREEPDPLPLERLSPPPHLLDPAERHGDVRPVGRELVRGRLPEGIPPGPELELHGHDLLRPERDEVRPPARDADLPEHGEPECLEVTHDGTREVPFP